MTAQTRLVTVVRGEPGSGKTFWLRRKRPYAQIVSANDYFLTDRGYVFDESKTKSAHGYCLREFLRHLEGSNCDLAVDNTNIKLIDMSPYIALASAFGATVEIVRMDKMLSASALAARNEHGVDATKIRRMQESMRVERTPSFWPRELRVTQDIA